MEKLKTFIGHSAIVRLQDESEEVGGVLVTCTETTDMVLLRKKIEERENNLRNIIIHSPVAMCILRGPSFVVELANIRMYELWGRNEAQLINKPIFEGLPEAGEEGLPGIMRHVYATGESFSASELAVPLPRNGDVETTYLNFIYEAYKNDEGTIEGVMVVATDVTEQVVARMKVEEVNQEFKFVTDFMPQIIWATNPDGYHDFYNKRWYDYTGLTYEQSKDTGWNAVLHADDQQRAWEVWRHSLKTGNPYEIEYRFKRFDGEYHWFLGRALPLRDDSGTILKWYGTCTEIDDQKKASELMEEMVKERTIRLENQKTLLDNILKNSSNGISVTEMMRDESGNVIDAATILANDAAVKFTSLPKDIYLSKTANQLDANILSSPYGLSCLKTLSTGEPSLIQYYFAVTGKWLELTISKMDDEHLIHIFTDVTPIKAAQLQLERTIEALKHSNANLEEFAHAASHDIKEPVRKVQIYSDRLKRSFLSLSDEQQKFFSKVEDATNRMSLLIDDLLDYSHVRMGVDLLEKIDLNKKLQLVISDLEVAIQEKGATINAGNLPTVIVHRRQLQQLFHNLIQNALKYSKKGIAPRITIISEVVTGRDSTFALPEENNHHLYNLSQLPPPKAVA